jgi:hypothetical protein
VALSVPADGLVNSKLVPDELLKGVSRGSVPNEAQKVLKRFQDMGGIVSVRAEPKQALRRGRIKVDDARGEGALKALIVQVVGKIRVGVGLEALQG